ncbi:hypothetical protein O59_000011 [Cellvibrio sp. BR]|nr:hypothetical protein O59_000011 [Cellvibrio sp. BR]
MTVVAKKIGRPCLTGSPYFFIALAEIIICQPSLLFLLLF